MVLSSRSRAVPGGALVFFLVALTVTMPPAIAEDTPLQRQELTAALRQLDALERFIEQSAASTPIVPGKRYHFDYPRLLADLARVRAGIQDYLEPFRAQPRDPDALIGRYRSESDPERQP